MTILIIEDEIKTARALQRNIESIASDAVVLDILQSVKSAVKWFGENAAPNLILSDIQLADGLSFEIFKHVHPSTPIIFCTAFDEYAIDAFQTSGIDYLLKPIDVEKLSQSLAKYRSMKELFSPVQQNLQPLFDAIGKSYKKTLLVHHQDKIIPVSTSDIAYFQYEFGNVHLVTFERKKHVVSQTLDEFEELLSPSDFFRTNRQFIVNRKAVDTISNYFSRRLSLKLNVPSGEILVSKVKAPLFLKWVEE